LTVAGLLVHLNLMAGEGARTRDALARERARAEEAEQSFGQARAAVDLLIRVSEQELADSPRWQGLRKRLLEVALDYYQDFLARRHDAPDREDLAAARERVREMLQELAALQGLHDSLLLGMPVVQDELDLSADQRKTIGEQLRTWEARRADDFQAGRERTPEERRRRFADLARSQEQALARTLTAAQRRRLAQVALQMQGPRALSDTETAAALGLTTDQRLRLREVEAESFGPGRPGPGGFPPRDPRQALERMLAELTPAQQARWRELTGDPIRFRGPMPFPFGPPPGPR
jgi:hypothetical protein